MGDFDGDGVSDYAVYHRTLGLWFIKSSTGSLIAWGLAWGGSGFTPVGLADTTPRGYRA